MADLNFPTNQALVTKITECHLLSSYLVHDKKNFATLFRCSLPDKLQYFNALPLSQPETSRRVNLKGMTYPIPNLCISQSLITELDMTPENSSTAPRRPV